MTISKFLEIVRNNKRFAYTASCIKMIASVNGYTENDTTPSEQLIKYAASATMGSEEVSSQIEFLHYLKDALKIAPEKENPRQLLTTEVTSLQLSSGISFSV